MPGKTRFVLVGFGNIGQQIATAVLGEANGPLELVAIAAQHLDSARSRAEELGLRVPVIVAADAPKYADIVVECATYDSFREVVEPALLAGCHVIAVSVGALSENLDLIDLAEEHGATLQIAGGTLPGLDILRAAREGKIESVTLQTQLLPISLIHEEYIHEQGIDLEECESKPIPIFSGTAQEAARHFPRHINVAVSLSLAGIGLQATQVEIYANGNLPGARHKIVINADSVQVEMISQNFPSATTNRTSRVVSLSILAALRELHSPLRIGS